VLDPELRELAIGRSSVTLATLMPGGQPQISLVWAHADDEHLLIGTNESRQKYRNAAADPRVTVLLADEEGTSGYVEVRGSVVAFERGEAAKELADTTFTKWTGSPPNFPIGDDRVVLRIAPDRVRWHRPRG